jgi:hypothetical protein
MAFRIPKMAGMGSQARFAVTIDGDKELLRNLKSIREGSAKRIMRKAITAGLLPVQQEAKRLVKARSLKRLIARRASVKSTAVNGMVYVKTAKDRTITLEGREVDFSVVANILEFGSQSRKIPARRFMRGARESQGPRGMKVAIDTANQLIEAEWRKPIK